MTEEVAEAGVEVAEKAVEDVMDPGAPPTPSTDAIIYVPGLAQRLLDQGIDNIGRKMIGALERNSEDPADRYKLVDKGEISYRDEYASGVRSLVREDAAGDRVVADLYELRYHQTLNKSFEDRSLLGKCLVVLMNLVGAIPAYGRAWRAKGKSKAEKAQLLIAAAMLFLIAGYFLVLVVTAAATAVQLLGLEQTAGEASQVTRAVAPDNASSPVQNAAAEAGHAAPATGVLPWLQALVVLVAGLGALSRESLKELLSEAATGVVATLGYLQMADRKQSVVGQLTALLEQLLERESPYRRVHLVTYSFGSVIALDALFPQHQPAAHLSRLDSLVTIGCPFDMIRIFWPEYFARRQSRDGVPEHWYNIYSRFDLLSSNFRDDDQEAAADRALPVTGRTDAESVGPENFAYDIGIQMGRYQILGMLTVRGLQVHRLYWEGSGVTEMSCFDLVVPALLASAEGPDV